MTTTQRNKLPLILAAQAQKHITHNEALRALDIIIHLCIKEQNLTAPPASPQELESYLIAAPAINEWQGREGQIASYQDGAWFYYQPQKGWCAFLEEDETLIIFDGNQWQAISQLLDLNNIENLGINASADNINRFALASQASLFNHEGAGHQIKLNKNTVTDTASLLFQTGFSGRAEMGTSGDDAFHFKVSNDNITWYDMLILDAAAQEIKLDAPCQLKSYTIAMLPSPNNAGSLIYVSDETGGATLAFSDGTNWRRVQDRAIVS